jgi:hypothetical protein
MIISGFTFVRNATKLAFPLKESITSILPLVDEYVIVFCEGDQDDQTLEVLNKINSDKIKIIHADWDPQTYSRNTLYAHLTDVAKSHCQGDWFFYLQCDEVIHEKDFSIIRGACKNYLDRPEIEGLLFDYKHFWGDYEHYFTHHSWYPREIRIIRNNENIHSWRDAQSFRVYEDFVSSTKDYRRKEGTRKLKVAAISAFVYHYGWVRHPIQMRTKHNRFVETQEPEHGILPKDAIDYGPLDRVMVFKETHPKVMAQAIARLDWQDLLQKAGKISNKRPKYKHEKLKYRVRSWIEINLLGGKEIGGFKNYTLIERYKD